MKFMKKPQQVVSQKKSWKAHSKQTPKPKVAYEPFHREVTRTVRGVGGENEEWIWVFEEYKKPDDVVHQHRLMERKFIQDGRERRPLINNYNQLCWEVDMEVRIEVYMSFQNHIAMFKDNK